MINSLVEFALVAVLTTTQHTEKATIEISAEQVESAQTESFAHVHEKCFTTRLSTQEVETIIRQTQTMDLNFVALAKSESHLNNHAKSQVGDFVGIFQVHTGFHDMSDYCDPAVQVKWLEGKLQAGADPKRLFPTTYRKLYIED